MVAVDDPDPPQEATIETESMGVLRAHTVVVQRLAKELHLRVQQGCELDAAQREKLGREDEILAALEAAVAVAEAAFAVPRTGPGSRSPPLVQRPQQPLYWCIGPSKANITTTNNITRTATSIT